MGRDGSLEPVDFDLQGSEVLGIAGLLGSGRTELANLIFGIETPDSGTLKINGKAINHFSPLNSINHGIALCPENRKEEGIVGELTVRENIILALQARNGWFRFIGTAETI